MCFRCNIIVVMQRIILGNYIFIINLLKSGNWVNLNGGGQRPAPIAASPAVSRMNNLQPLENLWGNTQNHCIHMRGLPFKASEMDIAEVINYLFLPPS